MHNFFHDKNLGKLNLIMDIFGGPAQFCCRLVVPDAETHTHAKNVNIHICGCWKHMFKPKASYS